MKKRKLYGWAFVATMMGIISCTNDAENLLSQQSEIKLTSEIEPSRVTSLNFQSTQIVEGQQIGVTIQGAKSEHNNIAWTAGANGVLTNTGSTIYYGSGDAIITAYHPYNSSWDETVQEFSVSTDQSTDAEYLASDLLWATATSSKTETAVPLVFKHKLAKINVTLTSEDITDLSNATISICGTNIATNFNQTDGTLSAATANVVEIKAGVTTASAYTASAIVIPQTVDSGTKLIKIEHKGKKFHYTLNTDKTLESGHSYSYRLKIKETKVEVEIESDNITDWTDEGINGDAEEVDFSWFNPNQYITYVKNQEYIYPNDDDTYVYSSYINNPIGVFSKIEFKYQMNDFSTDIAYLCCTNKASDNQSTIYMSQNGLIFDRDKLDDDDNDIYTDYSYTWDELNVHKTDCMVLTTSFKDKYIKLNDTVLEYKMLEYTDFNSLYLFTYYSSENDEGVWRKRGAGVPEGSKLYYVKMWDENDNLVYLGAASKALNPKTNQEEYCWRSYYKEEYNYEFAYYPENLSNYTPYGGGID